MKLAIIGAGPVGIYFSKLCLDKGFNVTLIDAGNRNQESILLNREKYIFNTSSALPNDVHKIGGGSTKWRGRLSEFIEQDFIKKNFSEEIGWPFSKKEFEKNYMEIYKTLGVGEFSDREAINLFFNNESIFLPKNFYFRSFRYCKVDFFIKLFDEIKNHKQFTLLENHFCHEIESKANKTLTIKVVRTNGAIVRKDFQKIVIAGGTLQTTALLQRSKKILPKNSQVLIGKNLMEHIEGYIGTIVVQDKFERGFFEKICNNPQNWVIDKFQGFGVAISLQNYDLEQLERLNVQFEIRALMPKKSKLIGFLSSFSKLSFGIGKLFNLLVLLIRVSRYLARKIRYALDKLRGIMKYSVYIKSEEIRNINSQTEILEIDPTVLKYNHQISDKSISLLNYEINQFKLIFNTHFSSKLIFFDELVNHVNLRNYFGPNWHPMGTTPFGSKESFAVCDTDLQVFGVQNLFVLSASVFPSGSNSNPTFTVLALAKRLANSKYFQTDLEFDSLKA
jgi:hypothetical protein